MQQCPVTNDINCCNDSILSTYEIFGALMVSNFLMSFLTSCFLSVSKLHIVQHYSWIPLSDKLEGPSRGENLLLCAAMTYANLIPALKVS